MINVFEQIGAVGRAVVSETREAGTARVLTISQRYEAEIHDVWDACTNAERLPRWFLPVSGDLELGGRYQLEGNAGGTVQRCDPPKSFRATWEYGGETSWIELRLSTEPGGGTLFELEHSSYEDDERWSEYGPGAGGVGWDLGLLGLALHLGTTTGLDPEAVMEWVASADGKEFMTRSSESWYEANLASGADTEAARAAADRTTAAYTAEG
ncbi:SRPBCC domain-containing protein [Tamaricihabitans halophyticus]|uniref:SRPBCC domain-containing protein n=1 Tax=Tamaricihabitans halophyticus TaxID=1262583 RepID=UPI00104EA58B|nr:SRPBCC domain-containing protein [Tamaricihabitans halophyticus]